MKGRSGEWVMLEVYCAYEVQQGQSSVIVTGVPRSIFDKIKAKEQYIPDTDQGMYPFWIKKSGGVEYHCHERKS
jgi:hypothetical protein